MDIINKKKTSVSTTTSQSRGDFFTHHMKLPEKLRGKKDFFYVKILGKDFKVEVFNRLLTQLHKDILYACVLSSKKNALTKNGDFAILFSLRQVLKLLSGSRNERWLIEKLKELMFAGFTLINPDDSRLQFPFQILKALQPSKIEINTNDKEKHYYYYAEISKEYLALQDFDIKVDIKKEIVQDIIDLNSGIIKKIVWFCLSQNELNRDLEDVLIELNIINNKISRQMKNKILTEIINNTENLEKFKIFIKKIKKSGRIGIFYKKSEGIFFNANKKPIPFKNENEITPFKTQ